MNDYKDRYMDMPRYEKTIHAKGKNIRGYRMSDITREDVVAFCKSRNISPEWLVNELIKEIR